MPPSQVPEERGPGPQSEYSRPPSRASRRGRSRTSRSVSQASVGPGIEEISHSPPREPSRNARRKKNKKQARGNGLPAVDEVEDVSNQVARAAPQPALPQGDGGGKGKDTLRLRLDLNLELEVTITAKLHGTYSSYWRPLLFADLCVFRRLDAFSTVVNKIFTELVDARYPWASDTNL